MVLGADSISWGPLRQARDVETRRCPQAHLQGTRRCGSLDQGLGLSVLKAEAGSGAGGAGVLSREGAWRKRLLAQTPEKGMCLDQAGVSEGSLPTRELGRAETHR